MRLVRVNKLKHMQITKMSTSEVLKLHATNVLVCNYNNAIFVTLSKRFEGDWEKFRDRCIGMTSSHPSTMLMVMMLLMARASLQTGMSPFEQKDDVRLSLPLAQACLL